MSHPMDDLVLAALIHDTQQTTNTILSINEQMMKESAITTKIVVQGKTIDRLSADMGKLKADAQTLLAAANAAGKTIREMAKRLAKAEGRPVDEVLAEAQKVRTVFFNRELNDQLTKGYLKKDPRLEGGSCDKLIGNWYDRSVNPSI